MQRLALLMLALAFAGAAAAQLSNATASDRHSVAARPGDGPDGAHHRAKNFGAARPVKSGLIGRDCRGCPSRCVTFALRMRAMKAAARSP